MVPPGDADILAGKITEVITNPDRMAAMSARNLEKSKQYTDEVLREKRIKFYQYVKETTKEWLKKDR
jgi:glycosyltransferase involved in cell wall biosynthesis